MLMFRFGSWLYYAFQLEMVEHQEYSDIEEQSNYHYDENCSYQMISGVVRTNLQYFSCCPEPSSEIVISLQLVPKETTLSGTETA